MPLTAVCLTAKINWSAVRAPVDAEIETVLARARKLNRLNCVTGALLLYPDCIVQWIEGEPTGLSDTRDCTARDPRLSALTTLCEGPVEARSFPRCWLYFADYREATDAVGARIDQLAQEPAPGLAAMREAFAPIGERLAPARFTHQAMLV
ncbi:BLUF domain-containing protein [Stappia sp.]|jgi:hypothetical protein|uniref:BLUF domain-containing protein n=1 Tax=Stappia sp. TaxID=1870903 RepID=UPI003A98DC64